MMLAFAVMALGEKAQFFQKAAAQHKAMLDYVTEHSSTGTCEDGDK